MTFARERNALVKQLKRQAQAEVAEEGVLEFDYELANSVRFCIKEYCREYFDFELEDFHVEILERMFDGGRIVVNLPSDHGKSTIACFLFPLLSLMEDPNETHIICGANINDSKRRVAALQRELETNKKLIADFPWLAKPANPRGRIWSTTQFNVVGRTKNKPNPSVLAAAIGSADIRGRRGKLIMDDIEGEEARYSPAERRALYDFVKFEAIRCYEDKRDSPRPLLIALGTPFDVDSIYFQLENEDWAPIRYPVFLNRKEGPIDVEKEEYLWPARKAKVVYMWHTLNKQQFSVMYLMDPTGGDPNILSYDQMRRMAMKAQFDTDTWETFVALDPASGSTNARADYAGVVVARIHWQSGDELPKVDLLEAVRCTEGLFEQVHLCAALADEYKCPVIYEANSQQGNVYAATFQHLHPEIPLLRHYTTRANKWDNKMGLSVLKTLIRCGRLRIDEQMMTTDENAKYLVAEMRDLGVSSAHDHLCAALWFIVRTAYEGARYGSVRRPANGMHPRSSGWGTHAINSYMQFGYARQRPTRYQRQLVAGREAEYERFLQEVTGGYR